MHYKTKKKLYILRKYIQRHYNKWHKEYPNLIGAYPGEKISNDEPTGKYSIVFLVSKKQKKPSKEIPKNFEISIPGLGKKKVPTDIIKSKKFVFRNANLSDKIKRSNLTTFGSTGVFLIKGSRLFACTNAHVLLPDMIDAGKTHFFKPIDKQIQPDVLLINNTGEISNAYLQEGFFESIDAAIARIDLPEEVGNIIPTFGRPTGVKRVQNGDEGLSVQTVGLITGKSKGIVSKVGITLPTSIPSVLLHDLIETTIDTVKGDSGSPVFTDGLRIVGIILGGFVGSGTSLIVPLDKILDAFKCELFF